MKPIQLNTVFTKQLADVYTPVGIYLRLRDRFRDTILLESTDFHAGENSYSIIGVNAIAGFEVSTTGSIETKYPGSDPETMAIADPAVVPKLCWDFMNRFKIQPQDTKIVRFAQNLFGYCSYDAIQCFESIHLNASKNILQADETSAIPLMRYRLYQYVIVFDHFKDELFICENIVDGVESEIHLLKTLIRSKDIPVFPFAVNGAETSNMDDAAYLEIVKKGMASCLRGDVFQIVLSRRFEQRFSGDEFNVYRALRSINPSPYLFYFDYGDYKLMGSSPESQLIVDEQGTAIVHPIAGTFKRTGNDEADQASAIKLQKDVKENAEHVMLVDLARNDLSKISSGVKVNIFKTIKYYSHVIHLVSEVTGQLPEGTNPFQILAASFPAGTLSGAPKFKAMQLIDGYEPTARGFYGGAIGMVGFNGTLNHAIMIRSLLSRNNTLIYQAGAGITAASDPASELQEVNNKLEALKNAFVAPAK